MVLKTYIRNFAGISALILLAFMFSCEELSTLTVDCNECTANDPAEVNIILKIDVRYGGVRINIYEGRLEDNVLYYTALVHTEEFSVVVPANRYYTVTATYNPGHGNQYVAIDAVSPHVKYDKNSCDDPCYYVNNNKVNLRLKYN